MLECLLFVAVATGVWRALRAGHGVSASFGVLVSYLLLADVCAAWAVSQSHHAFDVFSYAFLGPLTARERAATYLALPDLALEHPWALRAARIVLCASASWRCLRESARLNPLLPRAYALDGIALPFAGAAVVELLEGVVLVWAHALATRGA